MKCKDGLEERQPLDGYERHVCILVTSRAEIREVSISSGDPQSCIAFLEGQLLGSSIFHLGTHSLWELRRSRTSLNHNVTPRMQSALIGWGLKGWLHQTSSGPPIHHEAVT